MRQQRAETRISTLEPVSATILGHPDVMVACRVSNVSKSGLCLHVDSPIDEGRAVKVDWNDHFLIGRVCRNAPDGDLYRVGLELLYCSKWSESMETVFSAI